MTATISLSVSEAFAVTPGIPQISVRLLLVVVGLATTVLLAGSFVSNRPGVKAKLVSGENRALGWIEGSIDHWLRDKRLAESEADELRHQLREPDFVAVLPHFGAHLTIGLLLRFPVGSITRASYTLGNLLLAHVRFVTHRISYRSFRQAVMVHSPLVLVVTCLPGFGTFAYLLSRPFRSHHLLARVALDGMLLKLPRNIYEESGLRSVIARPMGIDGRDRHGEAISSEPRLIVGFPIARFMRILMMIAGGLFAADIVMQTVDVVMKPSFIAWNPMLRILDLNSESSLGTWFSVVGLFVCSLVLSVIAIANQRNGNRFARHWWVLAGIILGFSIDEQAKLHDPGSGIGNWARETLGLGGLFYYGWVLVAAASVIVVVWAYRGFLMALPVNTRGAFLLAGSVYVTGEAVVEMIGGWFMDTQGRSLMYQSLSSIEELLGMTGMLIALAALLTYIRDDMGIVAIRFGGEPRSSENSVPASVPLAAQGLAVGTPASAD